MEFRFSSFHAVQVPVVSDRLLITITSVDSGKTIAKSSKAAALNGTCQWHDSILQPIRFPKDEVSQEFQECQCKIVVSMGSTRTAILGEAYLNLTNYLSSSDFTDISLPLKRCNSGTVLQPNVFDIMLKLNKGAQSLSENHLEADYEDKSGNRDASFSASKSHGDDSSKHHLDTSEEKLEELRNAAKMWERHSRKLKIERKTLKNECADKSKQQAELERQLSASLSEQNSLRQEIEHVTDQLNKTQETNLELLSILQELEETIELQRVEMSKLPQASDVADHEVSKSESTVQEAADWARILSIKEDEITVLREKLNRVLKMENADGAHPDAIYLELEKENDFLKVKIQELENDCSELTEENLGLIYKLKEASGVGKEEDPCISNSEEMPDVGSPTYKIKYLESKCADLELNLQNFRSEFSGLEEKFQKSQEELQEKTLELSELREKLSHATELEGADTGSSRHYRLRSGEPDDTETDLDVLKRTVQLKEQEIDGLQHCTREMENTIADIQKEKSQLEERLAASLQESSMTSKCLDEAHEDLREDLLVLNSSVDSYASANKVLETKISELESRRVELELLVTKLEQENIEFSEFISELEAQLTTLTSEEESTKLEMDYSISLIANLKDLVEHQQAEMEVQKLEMKQKHLESQTRLSEVQEDSEVLRRSNAKLQATIDSVAEECSSLQTLTADLKKQKLELHDHCAQLEQQLDQSKRKTMDLFKQRKVTLKEQSLLSELENIFQEHKEHEERINSAHFLLHKIENEKIGEVKNLEREVMSLNAQLSSTDGERESAALDSIHEVSILRADKAKLEANLEDVSAQMRHYQSQLEDLRTESKTKIKGLIDSLNASKHNEETLTTDVEHMTRLMEAARSNEENLRKTSDELELKYKSSDYEKQQVMEEISGLKIQVNKMASIQDEVFKLQSSLDHAKFEKAKLEELLQSLSEECEELKVQKAMLTDKVSCIQRTLHDADEENCRKSTQAKLAVNKGNDDAANDNGGTHVNEDPDIHSKLELLETRLADVLEENKSYRAQLQSPIGEGQLGSRDEKDNKDGSRIAQLESELKDMQDRLLNVSMQYAEVEAQREELVMELKSATARKGRWF
ncbi:hypothetical protein ZWY2020_042765 [Hordeum vulgare]|nr:hypothetical protein ZWY2020_042765 [Hordeum vulgare]